MKKEYDINYCQDLKRLAKLESLIVDSEYESNISAILNSKTHVKQKNRNEIIEIESLKEKILQLYVVDTISEEEKRDCINSWQSSISRFDNYLENQNNEYADLIYNHFPDRVTYDSRIREIVSILKHLKMCGYDNKVKMTSSHFSVCLYRNRFFETIVIGHIKHLRYGQMYFPQPVYDVKGIRTKDEEVSTPSETIIHRLLEDEIIISNDYMHLDKIEKELEMMSKQPSDNIERSNLTISSSG